MDSPRGLHYLIFLYLAPIHRRLCVKYVEVKMDYIGTGRGILGGPGWTRLVAQHISRKVYGEWARGTEKSDNASQPGDG